MLPDLKEEANPKYHIPGDLLNWVPLKKKNAHQTFFLFTISLYLA